MTYPYGTKGAPTVGNGLGGLPRRAVAAGAATTQAQTTVNYALPGDAIYRNISTGERFAVGPVPVLNDAVLNPLTLSGIILKNVRTKDKENLPRGKPSIAYFSNGDLVVFGANAINKPAFCIISSDYKIKVPLTEISTSTFSNGDVAVQPNGNIVFVYQTGQQQLRFAIYNSEGALVVADTLILSTGLFPAVACDSNGNFVVVANNIASAPVFFRYSSSGVYIQGPIATTGFTNNRNNAVAFFSNNNFVIVTVSSFNNRGEYFYYTAPSTLSSNGTFVIGLQPQVSVSTAPSGLDWVVGYASSSTVFFSRFNAGTVQNANIDALVGDNSAVKYLPSGEFVIAGTRTGSSQSTSFRTYSSTATLIGSTVQTTLFSTDFPSITFSPLTQSISMSALSSSRCILFDLTTSMPSGSYVFDGFSNFSGTAGQAIKDGFVNIPGTTGGSADHRALGGSAYVAFGSIASLSS